MTPLLSELERIGCEAGKLIERLRLGGVGHEHKADGSPVTEADRAAEELILSELKKSWPAIPVVAEESGCPATAEGPSRERFFLVDPLDGTKEYISGSADFTVNIALVEDGVPVVGVVFAPARNEMFSGAGGSAYRIAQCLGGRGERRAIHVRLRSDHWAAAVSASHMTPATRDFLDALQISQCVSVGSSLKFCLVAAGEIDVYPRFGRTMPWDTAAGDAVLRNAGGYTLGANGAPLRYGPLATEPSALGNPHFIAVGGDSTLRARLREFLDLSRTRPKLPQ